MLTSTFWRNAWRYQERTYRHVFWDSGTIMANLLALANARGLDPALVTAFVDADLNALLGVDGEKEASVCVVWLGAESSAAAVRTVSPIDYATEPLSRFEIEYPAIGRMHEASSLPDAESVLRWREVASGATDATASRWSLDQVERVIERRGSTRHFAASQIRDVGFMQLIEAANHDVPADADAGCSLYAVVHAVEGLDPGVYRYEASDAAMALVARGQMRTGMAHAALDQAAAGEAAVCFVWAASLGDITGALGDRGYRAAQLDAAVRGGRVYLQATALGLRATGLTFYDDELASLLGLDPGATALLFMIAVGR